MNSIFWIFACCLALAAALVLVFRRRAGRSVGPRQGNQRAESSGAVNLERQAAPSNDWRAHLDLARALRRSAEELERVGNTMEARLRAERAVGIVVDLIGDDAEEVLADARTMAAGARAKSGVPTLSQALAKLRQEQ